MERAIGTIPPGTYRFTDRMDDDGLGIVDIPIVVEITVGNGRVQAMPPLAVGHIDFRPGRDHKYALVIAV